MSDKWGGYEKSCLNQFEWVIESSVRRKLGWESYSREGGWVILISVGRRVGWLFRIIFKRVIKLSRVVIERGSRF